MWWAALLIAVFLWLGLRASRHSARRHSLALMAIVIVLAVVFLRMPTTPSVP